MTITFIIIALILILLLFVYPLMAINSKREIDDKEQMEFLKNNKISDEDEDDEIKEVIRLVECCDIDEIYGYLVLYNVTSKEFQEKIYEIKDEGLPEDWCIDDVFERLPEDWKYSYHNGDTHNYIEI